MTQVHHSNIRRAVGLAALTAALLVGCGDDPVVSDEQTDVSDTAQVTTTAESSVPDPDPHARVTVPDGGEMTAGLSLVAGSGFAATPWSDDADECTATGRIVTDDPEALIRIAAWRPECVVTEGLNGQLQQYSAASDVTDPNQVATQPVTAGSAYVFDQIYTECTNSCTDYEHRVVLVELDQPLDAERTSVMISTLDDVSIDEMIAIADAIRVAPAG